MLRWSCLSNGWRAEIICTRWRCSPLRSCSGRRPHRVDLLGCGQSLLAPLPGRRTALASREGTQRRHRLSVLDHLHHVVFVAMAVDVIVRTVDLAVRCSRPYSHLKVTAATTGAATARVRAHPAFGCVRAGSRVALSASDRLQSGAGGRSGLDPQAHAGEDDPSYEQQYHVDAVGTASVTSA